MIQLYCGSKILYNSQILPCIIPRKKKKKSETVDHVCLFVLQVGVVGEYFSSLFTVQRLQSTIYPA